MDITPWVGCASKNVAIKLEKKISDCVHSDPGSHISISNSSKLLIAFRNNDRCTDTSTIVCSIYYTYCL